MADAPSASPRSSSPQAVTASWGAYGEPARLSDLLWIGLFVVLIVGTGLGVRMPWPADEPRFALVARDMVHSGDWLFPRIGGDLYPDKPPVFFWLLSIGYWLTGSIKASFLIPSFVAACTVAGLIYDLGRRLFGCGAGRAAAILLTVTVQFDLTMRGAQIDPTLCALTTLSLYGLLRHLLLGPAWGWYFIGGLVAGIGVVTKGVGFLPLLVLIPYFLFRAKGFPDLPIIQGGARWALAALGFVLGTAIWLVPMLTAVATRHDASLIAYRNEILFHQTVNRYAAAWHHVEPWYYFIVEVIPVLWLPFSILLIWLVPRWKASFQQRDARVWLPLAWSLLTLLFFSLSAGKRGVYLFPALPAAVLAAAPYLQNLFARKGIQRVSLVLGAVLVIVGFAAVYVIGFSGNAHRNEQIAAAGIHSVTPIVVLAVGSLIAWSLAAWKRPIWAWPATFAVVATVFSYGIAPTIDSERSASGFMREVLSKAPPGRTLGLMAYKEQFLLYLDRSVITFGHARWREGSQEAYDASAWLNAGENRVLLIPEAQVKPCFIHAENRHAGESSGDGWAFITGRAEMSCAERGDAGRALRYTPPVLVSFANDMSHVPERSAD